MSRLLVSQYHAEVEKIIQYGGSRKETSIRIAFQNLLNEYCKAKEFQLIPELDYKTRNGKIVYPDETVKDALRLDWGYWESKDQYDNLDQEIDKKLAKGYPDSNILFEDSQTTVLIQSGQETMRVPMKDTEALDEIITAFINYIRPEVKDFRAAIEIFKQDLPTILNALRDMIDRQAEINSDFQRAKDKIWNICKESINPEVTLLDIREMMIQHILTEDIFINIFNESQFHRENNIACELQQVINTFFTGTTKINILGTIERYYGVIRRTAANIYNHHEKQKFLKAVYENFYKAYNPKAAARLGIVYTPNEIVRFMIESVDYLTHKNFGKLLSDKDVEILDPATGTGTFVTELIEYLPKNKLEYKYKNEIHCNEVAILPYYIANLNIEFAYKQKMGDYQEFNNICFVDTLEHTSFEGKQGDLFSLSIKNTERIKRQNDCDISVIIGNPPYYANQANENDNNKTRDYPAIDKRIKETYIKQSTAQKTKLYDMYARFVRWASDRLGKNGVVALVSNNSFIDSRTFDGFRKVISKEFNEIYIIDLKGNARTSGERRRQEGGNVFSDAIRVGIAVYFLVRNENAQGSKIYYNAIHDYAKAEEKKAYLGSNRFQSLRFEHIIPQENNWINLTENNFSSLLLLADKETRFSKREANIKTVFKLFSFGVSTNRDEWVFDINQNVLKEKIRFFTTKYNMSIDSIDRGKKANIDSLLDYSIKWSDTLKNQFINKAKIEYNNESIINSSYRPYVKKFYYSDKKLSDRLTSNHYEMFNNALKSWNKIITFSGTSSSKPFAALATDKIFSLDTIEKTQCLPLYRYDRDGNRIDNITDWGLEQFQNHYSDSKITKLDIFHYTYAVLHNPAYRTKYELNLKREFPRLPFYDYFHQWVSWGKQLMDLHINYETVKPYLLKRIDLPLEEDSKRTPKAKLKADKTSGIILLDEVTTLVGIPKEAWNYQLT